MPAVSRHPKKTDAQIATLKEECCAVDFEETIRTRVKEKDRPQLQAVLNAVLKGDELMLEKLDRLGRTQVEVVSFYTNCRSRGSMSERWMDWST